MLKLIKEIIKYRELIWALALKDLRVRYKRSFLGFFWALLHPMLMMVVYTIVFSTIFSRKIPNYAIFLVSALFPWTFFTQSLNYSISSIIGNSNLLKKVRIPKSVFPVSAVLSNMINFLLSLIPLALLILLYRFPFHQTLVFYPVQLLFLFVFSLGIGLFLTTVNVFFRDVSQIIQVVLRAWFYFTPIIYILDFIPTKYHIIFKCNPMYYIIDGFHQIVYYGMIPSTTSTIMSFIFCFASLLIGNFIFRRYQDTFIYYL
ncbi:MAG: ABC transporter permease [Acidobacteria bacterium]|nr:ABC transporter permease [Acidobacteriota bacterium]